MGIKGFNQSGDDFVSKFLRATVHDSTGLDAVTPLPVDPSGMTATGGVINDYTDPVKRFIEHTFLHHQELLWYVTYPI